MIQVDFYLLERHDASYIYPFAWRLLDKIYRSGLKVLVMTNDTSEAQALSEFLWTYQDIGFLPHVLATDEKHRLTPIVIGTFEDSSEAALLFNLSHKTVIERTGIERILEIVPAEENWRQLGRKKYRDYSAQNFELKTHKIQAI